jgi:hypothetical protein
MSRFIQNDAGDWVNLDHVACVDRPREKNGRYKMRTADGTLVGIMRAGFDPDALLLFPPSSHLCWEQPLARKPGLSPEFFVAEPDAFPWFPPIPGIRGGGGKRGGKKG